LRKDFEKNELFLCIDSDLVVEEIHTAIEKANENL
tara:strand:- start:267566 stop:267670 length:105 start_codon:yes stop_codon:yes gene_type:complete